MKPLALAFAALLALGSVAQAQRAGTYVLTGTNADGGAYRGLLELAPTGPDTWRVTWRFGQETVTGTGMTVGNMLVVGYVDRRVPPGRASVPGIAWYELRPDGSLTGRWTAGVHGGVGTETLRPR